MNRKQAEEFVQNGLELSDNVIVRAGKKETIVTCSGVAVKEDSIGLKAYMVFDMPKAPRASKEITAKSKKGSK